MAGKQTSAGLLGLTVRRAKLYPKPCAVTSTASVLLSRCEPAEASALRDGVVRLMQEGQMQQQQQRNRMMMTGSNQSAAASLKQRGGGATLSSKAAASASSSAASAAASAAAAAAAAAASYLPPRSSMIVAHHYSKTPSDESRNKAAKASFFFSRKFYSPESVAEAEAAAARRAKRLRLEAKKNAANLANNSGPTLTADQSRVLDAILSGESVFFSGPAGTGKSVVLREAIKRLPAASTFVAAPTGLAAAALGGVTLHAFAGFGAAATKAVEAGNCSGFGGSNFNGIAAAVRAASRPRHAARWRSCRVLIVDEVSMVSAALFEALEAAARAVKRSERPFGGIQLVLCGDWLQLPPVVATSAAAATTSSGSSYSSSSSSSSSSLRRFAFQAACWERCVPREMLLETVHRQEGDPAFVSLLGRLRVGAASKGEVDELCRRCSRPFEARGARRKSMSSSSPSSLFSSQETAAAAADLDVLPTRLLTHRADVEAVNARQLAELEGEEVCYEALDEGDEALLDGSNSSSGTSTGVGAWARKTLVLKVGCQVLLTRNVCPGSGLVNGARGVVVGFGRPVCSNSSSSSFRPPIVRWAASTSTNDDDDEEEEPNETEVMRERVAAVAGGRVVAARTQLPLDLAFALSVHKCQGMTLEGPVECSLVRAFEPGMAYVSSSFCCCCCPHFLEERGGGREKEEEEKETDFLFKKKKKKLEQVALSRVRRLSNLRLVGGIAPAALAADESASAFYARLEGAGGDFVREEQRGGGGGRTSSSLSSASLSAPSSSSSLSLFSRGGDGDSYGGGGGSVDELAGSDSYGSGEQAAALESSRGSREGEEEEAWGAAVAADAFACHPARKKKRLAERGGLAIDF